MELRIKQLLKEKGITAVQLSEKLGVTHGALSLAINGNPTIATLEKIAEGLGVTIPELFQQNKTAITCPHCGKEIPLKIDTEALNTQR